MKVDDPFIDQILDGEASDSEMLQFERWAQSDENLAYFATRAQMHADLRRVLKRKRIQEFGEHLTLNVRQENEQWQARDEPGRIVGRRLRTAVAAAVVFFLVGLAILIKDAFREAEELSDRKRIATVVNGVDAFLMYDDRKWTDEGLIPGSYFLRSGFLELGFTDGVQAVLEAPAQFTAETDRRVMLVSGRLSARVPDKGIGFTVVTPEARVVDFGTEFSVDVESGVSEVHVFDGSVNVQPLANSTREVGQAINLGSSEAIKIDEQASVTQNIQFARDRFIRNLDEPKRRYARTVKQASPLAYFRMAIRDQGLVSDPPEFSGVVLTGSGVRPPHARGVLAGGSLRVGAGSTGRGGRVDSTPEISTGELCVTVFVYLESPRPGAMIVTNVQQGKGNFELSLDQRGVCRAAIRRDDGTIVDLVGQRPLPTETWCQLALTFDGDVAKLYEQGVVVADQGCEGIATAKRAQLWIGTSPEGSDRWDGRIDELAIFDKALSDRDIAQLFRTAQQERAGAD